MHRLPAVLRSILAVATGIAALTAGSFAIEAIANPLLLRMVGGGYLWRLTPRFPLRHGVIMGAIQVFLNFMAMLDYRDLAPLWVWIAGMALAVPAPWAGGILRERRAGTT